MFLDKTSMAAIDMPWQPMVQPVKCDSSGRQREEAVTSLLDKELWRSFHSKTNEMIVTKNGR